MTPDIQKLVEELRTRAEGEAEASRLMTDARFGPQYASIPKEQTASWQAADLITRLAGALEEARGILVELTEPNPRVTAGSLFFRAKATEVRARQALTGRAGE